MAILDHRQVLRVHKAILSARLGDRRAGLLSGMPAGFVATLPHEAAPADQVLVDVDALNAAGTLADGSVPLLRWLENAVALAGARTETRIFAQALRTVRRTKRPTAEKQKVAQQPARPPTKGQPRTTKQKRTEQEPPKSQVLFNDEIRVKHGEIEMRNLNVPMRLSPAPLHVRVYAEGKVNTENGFTLYVASNTDVILLGSHIRELREMAVPEINARVTTPFRKDVYLRCRLSGAWYIAIRNENRLDPIIVQARVVADPDA